MGRDPDPLELHERQTQSDNRDFSYTSGERQTATRLKRIREDHTMRYAWAFEQIKAHFDRSDLEGGDYFCGNGYGTSMLSALGSVTGIDGSKEAIDVANEYYKTAGVTFANKLFPFECPAESHDFIVSLESIEHVRDAEEFLRMLTQWLKPGGILIISTPNENIYPFDPKRTPHHFKHFTLAEIDELADSLGLRKLAAVGQKRSRLLSLLGKRYEFCDPEKGRFFVTSFEKA